MKVIIIKENKTGKIIKGGIKLLKTIDQPWFFYIYKVIRNDYLK